MMRTARLVAFAAIWALCACNPQPPKTAAAPQASARPRSNTSPLTLVVTGRAPPNGPFTSFSKSTTESITICLQAHTRAGPQNDMRSIFRNARVTFSDPRGSKITASAPEAVVDQTADAVTLLGGVVARSAAGMTLHCDRLVYRRRRDLARRG